MRIVLRRSLVGAIVSAALTLPSSAQAAESVRDPAAAEVLFRTARTAIEAGDYAAACPQFEQSYELDPMPGTLLSLAICDEHYGRLSTAWERFLAVVEKLPADDPRTPIAQEHAKQLDSRVPRLTLRTRQPLPAGSLIRRGALRFGASILGVPLPLDPSSFEVIVQVPGHVDRRYQLLAHEGENLDLLIEPGPVERAPKAPAVGPALRAPTAGAPEPDGGVPTSAYVAAGLGAAGLVLGSVAGLLALSDKKTMDRECNALERTCSSAGLDASARGRTLASVSTAALAVGIAGIGIGTYIFLGSRPKSARLEGRISSSAASVSLQAPF